MNRFDFIKKARQLNHKLTHEEANRTWENSIGHLKNNPVFIRNKYLKKWFDKEDLKKIKIRKKNRNETH